MAPKAKRSKPDFRNFTILNPKTLTEAGENGYLLVKRARQPRDAALKYAREGFENIIIRERGTDDVHLFKGSKVWKPLTESQKAYLEKYPNRIKVVTKNGARGTIVPKVEKRKPGKMPLAALSRQAPVRPSAGPRRTRKIVLSVSELTKRALEKTALGESTERAVLKTLEPIVKPYVENGDQLGLVIQAAFDENEWGWEDYTDIKTKKDMTRFMKDVILAFKDDYEDDTFVQVVR